MKSAVASVAKPKAQAKTLFADHRAPVQIRAQRIGEPGAPLEISAPEMVKDFWNNVVTKTDWYDPEKEAMIVLSLSKRLEMKAWHLVSVGTQDECICHPRDVFRPAILAAANRIIMVHNHPSGNPSPSRLDIELTRNIHENARMLRIPLYDHVVVAGDTCYSLRWFFENSPDIRQLKWVV